jgi:hypothetical protein
MCARSHINAYCDERQSQHSDQEHYNLSRGNIARLLPLVSRTVRLNFDFCNSHHNYRNIFKKILWPFRRTLDASAITEANTDGTAANLMAAVSGERIRSILPFRTPASSVSVRNVRAHTSPPGDEVVGTSPNHCMSLRCTIAMPIFGCGCIRAYQCHYHLYVVGRIMRTRVFDFRLISACSPKN